MATLVETFTPSGTPEPELSLTSMTKSWKYKPTQIKFDPAKHLAIEEPAWKKSLSEFGYNEETDGISPIGATAAFRIFTEEAVMLMRNDLLSDEVQDNHVFSTSRAAYQVRGYAPSKSKFIHDAWHSPEVLDAVSRAAGIELVPLIDYEIGHTNIQLGAAGPDGVRDLSAVPSKPLPPTERLPPSIYDSRPVDDWHYDGVPFVAVHMLSDTSGMQGGETAVQGKDGRISVVPGPAMGKVVVMQGSCLKHAALRSLNCSERIAMVTSLRPKNPLVKDMSHLRNIWHCSDHKEMGYQWAEYRLKVLEDRIRAQREGLSRDWDLKSMSIFANSLMEYVENTFEVMCRES